MVGEPLSQGLRELLPQLGVQPAQVADQLKALADDGDDNAAVLAAWAYGQSGQWQQGLPYARRAVDLGASWVAAQYVGNMIGQPEYRPAAMEMLDKALANGWSTDPLGWVGAAAQQNDADGVARMVALSTRRWPAIQDEELNDVLERFRESRSQLEAHVAEVDGHRARALERISQHELAVEEDRERLAKLTKTAEALAHGVASDALSKEYADDAKDTQKVAWWFTGFAIGVGVLAAVLAGYITVDHLGDEDPDILLGLAKTTIALPIALLAAYLGRLAGRYRDMAWRLRHMALQLRTAELYIAELAEDRRVAIIEQLALRFFPGQPQDITKGGDGGGEGPGLMAVMAPTNPPAA